MKKYFQHIAQILTPGEKKNFITLAVLNLLISIADIASLALLVFIVDFYTQPVHAPASAWLPGWLANRQSIALILLFFIVFSAKNYWAWLVHRMQCRYMAGVASRLSQWRLQKYLQGSYAQYLETDSSAHIRNIYFHPIEFCQHILDGALQMLTQAALITLAITAILLFNANLFLLLFLVLLPPVVGVFYVMKKRLRSVRTNTRTSSQQSLQYLQEALAGFVESNIYNKSQFFLQRYVAWQQQFYRHFSNFLIVQGTPARIIEIFALLGLFMLIVIGQWNGTGGTAAMVTVGAFMAAAYKIIPGIVKMLNIAGQMNTYEYTLQEPLRPAGNGPGQQSAPDALQTITFNDVHFRYNGLPVLQNLNLHLQPGDFLGISGASGKGKTTILNLMLGFLAPDSGEIMINDTIPASYRLHWKQVSYVKQQTFLLHDSILRNIVLDAEAYDEQKLCNILHHTGLSTLIGPYPKGLHKLVAEHGKNISGGQRQRIALARALYKEHDLILLDEPFNELDEESEKSLLSYFKSLAEKGKIVVLITHDKNSLHYCNKKISLDDGYA